MTGPAELARTNPIMSAGVVKPVLLLAACLASLSGKCRACHGASAMTTSVDQNLSGLEPALVAAGLENPGAAHHALQELGLTSLRDIRLLDAAEGVELKVALALADIVLGDRSKIRIAAAMPVEFASSPADCEKAQDPSDAGLVHVPRRLAEKGDTTASADTPWVSGDILALMVTALLGIGTFALQARSAKQSDANQRQIELATQEHETARATAERQLARVREQMALYAAPMVASCVRRPISLSCTGIVVRMANPLRFVLCYDAEHLHDRDRAHRARAEASHTLRHLQASICGAAGHPARRDIHYERQSEDGRRYARTLLQAGPGGRRVARERPGTPPALHGAGDLQLDAAAASDGRADRDPGAVTSASRVTPRVAELD